jgi:hypothetical protein
MTPAARRGLLVAIGAVVLFAAAFVAGKSTAGADEVAAKSGATSIELQPKPVEPIELRSTGPLPNLRPAPQEDSGGSVPSEPAQPAEPTQPVEPAQPADPAPPPPQPPPPDDFF